MTNRFKVIVIAVLLAAAAGVWFNQKKSGTAEGVVRTVIRPRVGDISRSIAATAVKQALPDGHTLLGTAGMMTMFPNAYKNLTFDVVKDFAPISLMSKRNAVMAVHPSLPARTTREFIALAKSRPGAVSYSSSGSGSAGWQAADSD